MVGEGGAVRMCRENDLGRDPVGRLVLRLALPSMAAQLVNILYSVVDRVYVGHIPEQGGVALASVGVCAPVLAIISAFSYLFGAGGAPLVSIKLGEGDRDGARRVVQNCFVLLLGCAAVVTALALLFRRPLLTWFGASDQLYDCAEEYFTVYLLGTGFVLVGMGMNQLILSLGYAKSAMRAVMLGAVLNIVLDPVFIFALGMGVAGAALATVLSQAAVCAYALAFFLRPSSPMRLTRGGLSARIMRRVGTVGLTPFLIMAVDNVMIISLNAALQRYGGAARGDMLVAANAIVQSFMMMITMPLGGITVGTQSILGYNYGARQIDRVWRAEKYIFALALGFVLPMVLIAQLLPAAFARIFTSDPQWIAEAARAIRISALGAVGLAFQYAAVDGFSGMGLVRLAMPLSMVRKAAFLLLVFCIPHWWDVRQVFWAEPAADLTFACLTMSVYLIWMPRMLRRRLREGPLPVGAAAKEEREG